MAGVLFVVCLFASWIVPRPGMDVRVEKCKSKRCLTCPDLVQDTTFVSSSTGQTFTGEYFFADWEVKVLTCTTVNLIYLLTCKACSFQYTGETIQQARDRMSGHRCSVDNDSSCVRVKEHFSLFCHQGFTIHIIGKLPGTGRTTVPKGKTFEIDSEVTAERRRIEQEWIRKLQACYPYGMNVKLDNIPQISKYNSTFGLMVSTKPNRKRSWAQRRPVREDVLEILGNQILAFFRLPFQARFVQSIRKLLFPLQKKELFWMKEHILKRFSEQFEVNKLESMPLYYAMLDLLQYKLDPFADAQDTAKKRSCIVCPVTFVNKGVEMLHLSSIFRNCKSLVSFCKFKVPDIAYRYSKTIGPKILNFKETVTSYDSSKSLSEQYSCVCQQYSSFIEESCGHVATGDLKLISNENLRDLISKGPGYREPQSINLDKLFRSIDSDIKEFIKKWSSREKHAPQLFNEWYHKVIQLVRKRISDITDKYHLPRYQSVFDMPEAAECLEKIKYNFVLVPVDKASKNIALICKQFYMKVLLDEIQSNTDTYIRRFEDSSSLSLVHQDYLRSLNISPPCDKLPYTYWTPKFHKPTLSQRFIVSYATCSIKPLANKLSLAFRVILRQIESFSRMLHSVTGIKHCWIIDNSKAIVDYLDTLNERYSGRNITTYDFTTLYTKLAHDDILDSMNTIIDLAFKKSKYKFISVYQSSSNWSNKPRPETFKFDAASLKDSLKFILQHSYFSVGSLVFQQRIGVPIGVDCAPAIADLTLFRYEYEYMAKLLKSDYGRALKLNGTFRLRDDISSINSDGVFEEDVSQIYPLSLELNKENVGSTLADILDLTVQLDENIGTFSYKLYDKRDKFNFEIVNYPDLRGNIAKICGYGVVRSELKRYSMLSSKFSDYYKRKKVLFEKVLNKGYLLQKIEHIYNSTKFNS